MLRKKYFLFAGIVHENDPETSSGQDDKLKFSLSFRTCFGN
jgi:hypothetical protein